MEITYYTKDSYGLELKYPVSRDAYMVCELTRTKTLTQFAINVVKAHGATLSEVLKPKEDA
jgi:hypothetical protein